jgi:hypothetical protein
MNATTEGFLTQLLAITQDVPGIVGGLTHSQFNWQPAPDRWSIGGCLEHLNVTTERYLPVLRQAQAEARSRQLLSHGPFALGFFESWFVRAMEPPPRRRFRTRAGFVPPTELDRDRTVSRFTSLQDQFADRIRESDGIDLKRVKVRSQFGPMSWSMNATFLLLLAHERRHLWQARQVRKEPAFPGE